MPNPISLALSPSSLALTVGRSQQLTSTATYDNGTTAEVTADCDWTSSNPAVATVTAGLITAVGEGSATITAYFTSDGGVVQNTVVVDDFNRSGPGLGANWLALTGAAWPKALEISSGPIDSKTLTSPAVTKPDPTNSNANQAAGALWGTSLGRNHYAQLRYITGYDNGTGRNGIMVRSDADGLNYYLLRISGLGLEILRCTNGVLNTANPIASRTDFGGEVNGLYRLEAYDNGLKAFLNDVEVLSATVADPPEFGGNYVGLRCQTDTWFGQGQFAFDDFVAGNWAASGTGIVAEFSVLGQTAPWEFTGGKNSSYSFSIGSGYIPPLVVAVGLSAGDLVTVTYKSGTTRARYSLPERDAAGSTGTIGADCPAYYMNPTIGSMGLVGAFVDDLGNVIEPVAIGLGRTLTTPAGATKLQLGLNDHESFADNLGSLAVEVSTRTVKAQATVTVRAANNRYRLNGPFESSLKVTEALAQLLGTFAGMLVWSQGKWVLSFASLKEPVLDLTDADARGPLQYQTQVSLRDRCNGVKGVYISPTNEWQASDFPAYANAKFIAEDSGKYGCTDKGKWLTGTVYHVNDAVLNGSNAWVCKAEHTAGSSNEPGNGADSLTYWEAVTNRIWRDVRLPFTLYADEAQRLSKLECVRSRLRPLKYVAGPRAYSVRPGEIVTVTHARFGWDKKRFEVVSTALEIVDNESGPELQVPMVLREDYPEGYGWTKTTEERDPSTPGPITVTIPSSVIVDDIVVDPDL